MSSKNLNITWLRDDTIRVECVCKNFAGALYDPDSHVVIMYDPSGTNMGTLSTSKTGTGTYTADYSIPAAGTAGNWKVSWKALSGTVPAREIIYFKVAEG